MEFSLRGPWKFLNSKVVINSRSVKSGADIRELYAVQRMSILLPVLIDYDRARRMILLLHLALHFMPL